MIKKRALSVLIAGMLLSMPICVSAQDSNSAPKTTTPQSGVNEQARLEAYNEYAAPEAERDIDIVPLFNDWNGKEALKKINNIGNKILLSNKIDNFVRFEVSRKETVNAYASYNGIIRVYKGLLNYVENEDELAYVLGHELSHITYDDNKKSLLKKGLIVAAAAASGVAVGASTGSGSDGSATAGGVAIAGGLINRKYSRNIEARADIIGIDYMVKAGYNPWGAISMINKIVNRRWDGISDHPSGDRRLINAYHHIVKTYPKYIDAGFNTISYERAMIVINKMLSDKKEGNNVKQTRKSSSEKSKKSKIKKDEN